MSSTNELAGVIAKIAAVEFILQENVVEEATTDKYLKMYRFFTRENLQIALNNLQITLNNLQTKENQLRQIQIDELSANQGTVIPPTQIENLYEPSVSPSSVKSEDIIVNQLDETYYSPCANIFTIKAHRLAYETLPDIQGSRLFSLVETTISDLKAAMSGSEPLGYCSQKHLKEEGVTALLTANISKCFAEYCRNLNSKIDDRVSIMHQSLLATKAGKGDMDIALFYRFLQTDEDFVHRGLTALFPFLFIEFTKVATRTIDKKLPQAALYANHLFRLMGFDKYSIWVPLLGVVMSENEMLFRLYSPSLVENKWKIAEVDVMRCSVSTENFRRLVHIMVGWTTHCTSFLCSPMATSRSSLKPYLNPHLLLHKHSNIVELGNKVFKCFDYREISGRSYVHPRHRREPRYFYHSDLTDIEMVVDWTSSSSSQDSLQIISYNMVPGVHYPSFVDHLTQVLKKIAQLHALSIVHGDLRFSNIVFSDPSKQPVVSTIIDFDYSGLTSEKIYPPRFNLSITDGFRHCEARPYEFLRLEHDIAAVKWMCEQYHPKNIDLRELWVSSMRELVQMDDVQNVIDSLTPHGHEELEPVDKIIVVVGVHRGTGSPDTKRTHYI